VPIGQDLLVLVLVVHMTYKTASVADDEDNDKDSPSSTFHVSSTIEAFTTTTFSSDFGPSALLYPTPTLMTPVNYGEGLNPSRSLWLH